MEEHKVQYDVEGRALPARQGATLMRLCVVWIVLGAALMGGFAGAYIFHRLSRNCPITDVILESDQMESLRADEWTETRLAIAKEDVDYMVVIKRHGLLSKPEFRSLAEWDECVPAQSKELLRTARSGSMFIMRLLFDGEDKCFFDFLEERELFNEQNSEADQELLDAISDKPIQEDYPFAIYSETSMSRY